MEPKMDRSGEDLKEWAEQPLVAHTAGVGAVRTVVGGPEWAPRG